MLTVRYFASLREAAGLEQEEVAVVAPGVTLPDLLEYLRDAHDELFVERLVGPGVRIAVNDELLDAPPGLLGPGDVVAFLPPVTGG